MQTDGDKTTRKNDASPTFLRNMADCQSALFVHISVLLGGDTETARDVLQDTNLYLMQCNGTYDASKSSFLTWAKMMASQQVRKQHLLATRRKNRMVYAEDIYDKVSDALAEEPEPPNDMLYALRLCLKHLAPKDRHLLDLHYEKRELLTDLSQKFHTTVPSLKTRFMRLRDVLAKCISGKLCKMAKGEEESPDSPDDFGLLLSDVLEGNLLDGNAFNAALRETPSRIKTCIEQMTLHALLVYKGNQHRAASLETRSILFRCIRQGAGIAAILTLLLAGGYTGTRLLFRPAAHQPAATAAPLATDSRRTAPAPSEPEQKPSPRVEATAPQISSEKTVQTNQVAAPTPISSQTPEGAGNEQEWTTVASPERKEQNMNVKSLITIVAATGAALSANATDGFSAPVTLNVHPDATVFWRTVCAATPPTVRWGWPGTADAALLSIQDRNGTATNSFAPPTTECTLHFALPQNEDEEDVYTFTLSFSAGGKALPSETLSARIGVVRGTDGTKARLIAKGEAEKHWQKTTALHAVLPVSAGAQLVLNGKTVDTGLSGAAGWYSWGKIPLGTNTAQRVFASGVLESSSFTRISNGTVVILK